ncbi:MAG: hypothetical protein Q3993_02365 [Filifactor alocis]|nr:hypothetical protein [Filifactor alocis]
MIRIQNIKLPVKELAKKDELSLLQKEVAKKIGINRQKVRNLSIYKKSIDARKKENISFVYSCDFETDGEESLLRKGSKLSLTLTPDMRYQEVEQGSRALVHRPVIVGTGPAGLFAGLILARRGYRPLLLERGDDVDERKKKIDRFWETGELDTQSNVQFGEGGAGTFSDGKLTSLIHDKRCRNVLEAFIEAGAPQDILYKNKPHIGTDILRDTVKRLRQRIIELGGEVRFRSQLTDIKIEDGRLVGIEINEAERMDCEVLLLATGHSARDTFEMLYHRGLDISQKAFSIGVRVEHSQSLINRSQYGADSEGLLGAADYKLSYRSPNGRSAYTFCMCPGGYVVAAASEEGMVVTNGMSEYKRDGENANSALLVNVTPEDFGSDHPLAGVDFQRRWERLAFEEGGRTYCAPAQRIGDFLDKGFDETKLVRHSYRPGITYTALDRCLPDYVISTMKEALVYFDERLEGFASGEGLMIGVETRSSSPIRMKRNEDHISNLAGVYPVGEGAGYAGGIMSAAVDGVKTAEKVIMAYRSFIE